MDVGPELGGDFGTVLREYRSAAGLTQEELADRSGLSVRAIRDIEGGRTSRPFARSTRLLAAALELDELARARLLAARNGRWPSTQGSDQADGQPDVEAPLPTADGHLELVVPRQLPAATSQFVGRAAEIEALDTLLEQLEACSEPAAVAISGTAGVGKTALAVRWAQQVAGRFPDGQLYVDLRGFGAGSPLTPAAAVCGFLEALGVPPARIPAQPDAQVGLYRSLLADKRMLVVLDNASDANQVRPLFPAGPGSLALLTSRNSLAGLAVAQGARQVSLEVMTGGDAHTLLEAWLGEERVAVDPMAARALVELTARLPLALSIAAARATAYPAFPLAALAAELRDARGRLDALSGGDQAADVRAAISWSYLRLGEPAARMFRLLGSHPGPDVTVAAAASLCGTARTAARLALAELVAGGLVTEHAPGRFACHDLLRVYAVELSQEHDSGADRRRARHRLLDHYMHTGHAAMLTLHPAAEPVPLGPLSSGAQPEDVTTVAEAVAWLTAEHEVLLSASGAAAQTGFDRHAWQVPLVIMPHMSRRGHWVGWVTALRTGLAAAHRTGDERALAVVHRRLGQAEAFIGNHDEAAASIRAALRTSKRLGDQISLAYTYTAAAVMREHQQCFRESLSLSRRALGLFRACRHQGGEALALNIIGWDQVQLGDYPEALANSLKSLRLCRDLSDLTLAAAVRNSLGLTYQRLGQRADAISSYQQAISESQEIGQLTGAAANFEGLGDVHHEAGDLTAAAEAWRQALEILTMLHHPNADGIKAKLRSLEPVSASRWPGGFG